MHSVIGQLSTSARRRLFGECERSELVEDLVLCGVDDVVLLWELAAFSDAILPLRRPWQ